MIRPIVRFAPSPTGYLHIGGARTALFNYLFAKNTNGKFLLRIEDTDKQRSTKEAIDAIIQGLEWLGLKHDENYILQSSRQLRHKEIALELLNKEKAYYCYTSQEELDDMRKHAEKNGKIFRFKSPWRDKIMSQKSSVKPVIRIKSPLDKEVIIRDLVQGEITVKSEEIDDLVMLRSDESATYMLAVVVDDHDMNITHIIRGDDHLTNAFRQKIIYQAMNWEVPEFAHIPLIHGADGSKMSKRHGATSVIEYKQMGYLPEAMRNYLLRLGWSHGDDELISDEQAIKWFSLDKIGKSPSRFDFVKLNSINKHYLKKTNEEDLFLLIREFLSKNVDDEERQRIIKCLKFSKEKSSDLRDLANNCEIYLSNYHRPIDEASASIISQKKYLLIEIFQLLNDVEEKNFNHDYLKEIFDKFCNEKLIKLKDFGPLLRIALTFSQSSSGGIFDIISILKKEESLLRIKRFIPQDLMQS